MFENSVGGKRIGYHSSLPIPRPLVEPISAMTATETAMQPLTSSRPDEDIKVLQDRLEKESYLCIRGLAPKQAVLDLRRDILTLCAGAGWLDPKADLMEGRWSGGGIHTENEPNYMALYKKVVHLANFNNLPQMPVYVNLISKLIGGPAFNHNLRIGRITFPRNVGQTTGAHQDWQYIRGTPDTYTIWTPLGDCPVKLGGLAILRGSHKLGFLEHKIDPSKKYAGSGVTDDQWAGRADLQWVAGDMQLGDVLLFHAFTIHKALPNLTENQLRLSTDNRYQRVGEEIEAYCLGTHYRL